MSDVTSKVTSAGVVLTLAELAAVLNGTLAGPSRAPASSYAIDSRAVRTGTVFFALGGQRTDGHRFSTTPYTSQGAACQCDQVQLLIRKRVSPHQHVALADPDDVVAGQEVEAKRQAEQLEHNCIAAKVETPVIRQPGRNHGPGSGPNQQPK